MALNGIGRKALLGGYGTQRKIAKELGIHESRVSAVINGFDFPRTERGWQSYNRIQTAIAQAIGVTVEEAFSAEERGAQEEVAA
jgi:transcriptional regulator with XRE-family HTH domain